MAISHIPRSVGHNFAPEYQISAVPYFIDADEGTTIKVDNEGKRDVNGANEIKEVKLPKISQWLQFNSAVGANVDVTVYFSRKEAKLASSKGIIVSQGVTTRPLNIRCSSLYFVNVVPADFHIVAGLTSIPSSEFTEVVEAFLGDDIT
jgi:hypothetical protein